METRSRSRGRDGRRRFAVGFSTLSVFLVVALSGWFASRRWVEAKHAPARTAAENRAKLILRLQAEHERLKSEQRELVARVPALAGSGPEPEEVVSTQRDARRVAGLELMVQLEAMGAISQNTSLHDCFKVDYAGRLPDRFARLFDLPAEEFKKLQEILESTKQHLEAAAIAGTTVRRESDTKLLLEIKVASDWAVQREGLRNEFLEVLGPEQMRVLEHLGRGLDRLCEGMETKNRNFLITRTPTGSSGENAFAYEIFGKIVIRSTRGPGVPRSDVLNHLGRWAQFLPADF